MILGILASKVHHQKVCLLVLIHLHLHALIQVVHYFLLSKLIDFILVLLVAYVGWHPRLLLKGMNSLFQVFISPIFRTLLPILVLVLIFVSPPLSSLPPFRFRLVCALLSLGFVSSRRVVHPLRAFASILLIFLLRTRAPSGSRLLVVLSLACHHSLLDVEGTLDIDILFFF